MGTDINTRHLKGLGPARAHCAVRQNAVACENRTFSALLTRLVRYCIANWDSMFRPQVTRSAGVELNRGHVKPNLLRPTILMTGDLDENSAFLHGRWRCLGILDRA
jgi:hypothetical protein